MRVHAPQSKGNSNTTFAGNWLENRLHPPTPHRLLPPSPSCVSSNAKSASKIPGCVFRRVFGHQSTLIDIYTSICATQSHPIAPTTLCVSLVRGEGWWRCLENGAKYFRSARAEQEGGWLESTFDIIIGRVDSQIGAVEPMLLGAVNQTILAYSEYSCERRSAHITMWFVEVMYSMWTCT